MTTGMMVDALEKYCDKCKGCENCELKNLYDEQVDVFTDSYGCVFDKMDDKMLDKCYNWLKEINSAACENAETKESNVDMVNHHKNIVEEMRRLFDLFDGNVEIFINKFNKTVDIHIQM